MCSPETKSNPEPTMASALVMARSRFPVWLIAALLALVTITLYWPAMRHDFVNFDDPDYVTANPHVQGGLTWSGLKWAFCNTEQAAYWAPLMWLSHMLACQLFGLNPWGHHLINVLLHAVNTVLVFLLLRRLTGALWRSVLVAALFGLHPLRVESVAWVTERKDVLSTCFGLLALLAYTRYAQHVTSDQCQVTRTNSPLSPVTRLPAEALAKAGHSSRCYWLALFFFALGLMSKPMLVTWPFVMLLLDYWPLQRVSSFKFSVSSPGTTPSSTLNPQLPSATKRSEGGSTLNHLLFEKWPFFGLAAVASVVTFLVQQHGGAFLGVENLSLGARSGNALISYCRYLGKLFWPMDLAVFYPHPGHWPVEQVFLAGGLILGISVLFFVKRGRYPFLLMGWLWFVGTLVPVIGLVQAGWVAMADRFTYIPSLGVLVVVIWGAYELTRRWRYHELALSVAGCLAIVLCIGLTRQQLGHWQDSEALYRHALEVTENNYLAHNNLGHVLLKKNQIDEAISQFQEAIRLKPDFANAHYNLGVALNKKGQTDEAIRQYQEAIRLPPDYAATHNNLASALVEKGQTDEAISQYREAIRLKPDYAGAYNNLGNVLLDKGKINEAINQYQKAIRLAPDDADTHYNLGTALGMKGQTDEAISQYREAIRLAPDYADAHNNLGNALSRKGQTDEAISQYREAIRLNPDYAEARNNLAHALEMKNTPAGR
jgi:tetratricopeptide (TPR) repeat protein